MFVLIAIIAIGISSYLSASGNTKSASASVTKPIGIAYLAYIAIAIGLSVVSGYVPNKISLIMLGAFAAASIAFCVIVSSIIKMQVSRRLAELEEIYPAITALLKLNGIKGQEEFVKAVQEDPDLLELKKSKNDMSFSMKIGPIESIEQVHVNKTIEGLNKFFKFEEKMWAGMIDYEGRRVRFRLQRSIPNVARHPGVDFRSPEFIEVGVGGVGAACWRLGGSEPGMSSYVYPDGEPAKTTKVSALPQGLILGTTGSGKSIATSQLVDVFAN